MKTRIGTFGWNYPHWKEKFYPKNLPAKKYKYQIHFNLNGKTHRI